MWGQAIKQGTLTKQGAIVKSWKKRHCVISHGALLYYKSNTAPLPQGGLTLMDAAVTFSEGLLQVRSPVSYTSSSKGKVEESRDRVFKVASFAPVALLFCSNARVQFKGEPNELKDWLYQLTATKNQLVDRSILKQLAAKQAEVEAAQPLTEEHVSQYLAAIERVQSQVTSASQGVIDEHKARHAEMAARLGAKSDVTRTPPPRKAPAPPNTPPAGGQEPKQEESSDDEMVHRSDQAMVAGLDEALKNESKVEEAGKPKQDEAARLRAVTRDEASDYMDMANELAGFDSIIDKMDKSNAMKPFSMPASEIEPVPEFDSASVLELARKEREEAENEAAAAALRVAAKKAEEEERVKREAERAAAEARDIADAEARAERERQEVEAAKKEAKKKAKKEREEAERKAKDEADRRAQEEAAQLAKEEEEKREREKKAREELEKKEREEAEREEAEARARKEEADKRAAAEEKARAEAAAVEASRKAKEEAERAAREEAERAAKEEAARVAEADKAKKEVAKEEVEEKELDAGLQRKLVLNLEKVADKAEEEKVFCTECGVQAAAGSRFCKECGTPLKVPEAKEQASPRDETPEDKAARKKAAARKLIEARAAKKSPTSSPRASPRGGAEEEKKGAAEQKKPAAKKAAPAASELDKKLVGASGKVECDGCGETNKADYKVCVSCGKPRKK